MNRFARGCIKRTPFLYCPGHSIAPWKGIRIDACQFIFYKNVKQSQGGETVSRGVPVPELKVQFFPLHPRFFLSWFLFKW